MTKQYAYIGSQEIIDNLPNQSARIEVSTASNVLDWVQSTHQKSEYDDRLTQQHLLLILKISYG